MQKQALSLISMLKQNVILVKRNAGAFHPLLVASLEHPPD